MSYNIDYDCLDNFFTRNANGEKMFVALLKLFRFKKSTITFLLSRNTVEVIVLNDNGDIFED